MDPCCTKSAEVTASLKHLGRGKRDRARAYHLSWLILLRKSVGAVDGVGVGGGRHCARVCDAFALADVSSAPCGAGTVLKVGRVGARSDARFRSQHYSPHSAGSTLARSLLTYRIIWPWLGIEYLDEHNVKSWMLSNLDRMHIFVPDGHPVVAASLEVYGLKVWSGCSLPVCGCL